MFEYRAILFSIFDIHIFKSKEILFLKETPYAG